MPGTRRIEINFPCEVNLPPGFEKTLDALVDMACNQYELEHPGSVMWPASYGGLPLGNIMVDEYVEYDMSVYCINVSEREAHDKESQRREPMDNKIAEMRGVIRVMAEDLKRSHSLPSGEWPDTEVHAKEEYDHLINLIEPD